MQEHGLADGRPSVRLSNAKVIGSVRDCASSTLPDAHEAAGRHPLGLPGDSRSRRHARSRARAASASGICPTTWTCDGIDDAEQDRSRGHVGAGGGLALGDHAADRRADDERARPRPPRPPAARRCTAPGWPRRRRRAPAPVPRPHAPRRVASRAPRRRWSSRSARSRSRSPARARSAPPRAPAAAAAVRPARRAGGAAARAPGPRDTLAPSGTSTTRVSRPSIGATTSAAPPGRASIRAGTRIDSRTACSVTTAVPKSRLHCCSLRKLMPGAVLARWRRGRVRGLGIRHARRRRRRGARRSRPGAVQHDDQLARARAAPASRRRRRCPDATARRHGTPPAGPAPPCRRTSTRPSVSALKESSRVR